MINLSKKEKELLMHRAEVPDCLYEVLGEQNENIMNEIEFDKAYRVVKQMIEYGAIDKAQLSYHAESILVDCLCGSTWSACLYPAKQDEGKPEYKKQLRQAKAATKVLHDLAIKFTIEGFKVSGNIPVL